MTYTFLQQYWWFLVALLGGLLVFLLFVQGANSLIFSLGRTEEERALIVNSTGRKWEFTFTTLVTFGGAFFAAFPLFYSTSFGGAYWVWMLILATFIFQAVSYEFQSKAGNLLGRNTYRRLLVANGILGPLLLGMAVATFFTGSAFVVEKDVMGESGMLVPAISRWANAWHGLDAVAQPWNLVFGMAVVFLARVLGSLYLLDNLADEALRPRIRRQVLADTVPFLICFLAFVVYLLTKAGFAVDETGAVSLVPYKYLTNFLEMPATLVLFAVGVVLVLFGVVGTLVRPTFVRGIWPAGIGTVLTVVALFLVAGYNGTSYYPSTADLQSSLTLTNSCSSLFTLKTMAWVSLLIPFVLAYIIYAWHAIDRKGLSGKELETDEHKY
ncbi:MAG: cytochrome d ubiquinol oxidase subunit II [Bacteroidales bacterium]|nr:cytochrome d ubiquinol oxidase subunit II [Bacteroidales bacterium]